MGSLLLQAPLIKLFHHGVNMKVVMDPCICIYIFTIYKSYLPPIISCDFHNSFMKWVEITTLVL